MEHYADLTATLTTVRVKYALRCVTNLTQNGEIKMYHHKMRQYECDFCHTIIGKFSPVVHRCLHHFCRPEHYQTWQDELLDLTYRRDEMLLYFCNTVEKLRTTPLEFFETAYIWRFDKLGHVTPDFCEYLNHGILPKYVVDYLNHLKQIEVAP